LDKILNLLQPKIIETVAQAPSVIEEKFIKEVKVPKVKKVTKKAASTKEK